MKKVVASVLLLASMSAWAQQAPFCAVTASGSQCSYYSLSACQQAVQGMDGACAANVAQQPQSQIVPVARPPQFYDSARAIQQPDVVGSFQRGQEQAMRLRQAQEEHDARVRLLDAQAAALTPPPVQQPIASAPVAPNVIRSNNYSVVYQCHDASGQTIYATTPAIGCVVIAVTQR